MEDIPMLADMGSSALTDLSGEGFEFDKMGIQKISVSEETSSLKFADIKSDSFMVDMDRFSHLADKDVSRVTLQRTVSRKGQGRSTGEKKTNSTATSERDSAISSPRSVGVLSALDKSMVVTMGAVEPPSSPHHNHHQITIVTAPGNNTTSNNSENRLAGKRYSFKRSSPSNWSINPRRILLFFATLSSIGTILLIYFTLSMGKLNGGGGDGAAAQNS